jgi:hypothetical protein
LAITVIAADEKRVVAIATLTGNTTQALITITSNNILIIVPIDKSYKSIFFILFSFGLIESMIYYFILLFYCQALNSLKTFFFLRHTKKSIEK